MQQGIHDACTRAQAMPHSLGSQSVPQTQEAGRCASVLSDRSCLPAPGLAQCLECQFWSLAISASGYKLFGLQVKKLI